MLVTSMQSAILRAVRRATAAALCVISAGVLGACAGPGLDHEEDLQTLSQELKNAPVLPRGAPLDGVVLIRMKAPVEPAGEDRVKHCTGQIISPNTVLTAAHCLSHSGFTGNVGQWEVMIWKQVGVNDWEFISGGSSWLNANVYVHPSSWTTIGHDVALIRHPSAWSHVAEEDSGLIMTRESHAMTAWATGFGLNASSPTAMDFQLRAGEISVTANNLDEYVYTASGSTPQICSGDSGGPLKKMLMGWGLVYGLASGTQGGDEYCGSIAYFASTYRNWEWIRDTMGTCETEWVWLNCW